MSEFYSQAFNSALDYMEQDRYRNGNLYVVRWKEWYNSLLNGVQKP